MGLNTIATHSDIDDSVTVSFLCWMGHLTLHCTFNLQFFSIACHDSYDTDSAKISFLEETLASKLAEFLDSSFPYTLHLIPSAMKSHLYKGPSAPASGSFLICME